MVGIIWILKLYFIFTVVVMVIYGIRHYIFTYNRLYYPQRKYCQDILDTDVFSVSVVIPMHNEEAVAEGVLQALLRSDYPEDKLEIIPINDFSEDKTQEILDKYAQTDKRVHPLHRFEGDRGKPAALNEAMKLAKGEIIIVFDADYIPARDLVRKLSIGFLDPQVGAVMGRVVPVNTSKNILTRLLDLERSGGYQVDQQARYNMDLLPQYGGTVGGFRKALLMDTGSFNIRVLAEDTELTYRLFCRGWKVSYANSAECYEEAPESWEVRARQIQRWSRGHNQCMWRYFVPVLKSTYLNFWEKLDGLLLLCIYMMPVILLLGLIDSLLLFFMDEMHIIAGWLFLIFLGAYNTFGNFAPFFEIGTACFLDGARQRVFLLPYIAFNFYFYMWFITKGFFQSILDLITHRKATWQKTARGRQEKGGTV